MLTALFQTIAGVLVALFLYYGMDVRRKDGARDFAAPAWQTLVKLCSFLLIGAFLWIVLSTRQVSLGDWLDLSVMMSGTTFVMAAKKELGRAHTFTGQYLDNPRLVTTGVYAITRNPLYFGVLQCEVGASLFVVHQGIILFPRSHPYGLSTLAVALLYAVFFNWNMAVREARYLLGYFGEEYRRYSADVPFVVPLIKPRKDVK
jgi:protein-S-isoprenylcysteine O-methyltransferase Ste14